MANGTAGHRNRAATFHENAATARIRAAAVVSYDRCGAFYREGACSGRPNSAAPACAIGEDRAAGEDDRTRSVHSQAAATGFGSDASGHIAAFERIIGLRAANRSHAACVWRVIMNGLGSAVIANRKRATGNYDYASAGIGEAMVIQVEGFLTAGYRHLAFNVFQKFKRTSVHPRRMGAVEIGVVRRGIAVVNRGSGIRTQKHRFAIAEIDNVVRVCADKIIRGIFACHIS